MEIGVVVHGPGIVDSGWAKKIIDILSNFGNVHCRLGGTMGRTAVIDAGLEDIIDISLKLLPSQSLELYNRNHVDVIFLLNYGKSAETGQVFGYKVFTHYFKQISNEDFLATNHKSLYESRIPVIQIERPGEEDGSIISWNVTLNEQLAKSKKSKRSILGLGKDNMVESLTFNFEELFDGLKAALELKEVTPEEVVSNYFSNVQQIRDNESIEKILKSYDDYEISNYTYRKIHGVSEGENIFINGIVIGKSNADSIILIARDGFIVDIYNGTMKYHGVEKLGPVDLDRVIVKTGLLRKSEDVTPRILSNNDISVSDTERLMYSEEISEDEYSFKIAYVDHAAYDIYKFKDFDLVVTVGDDTSLVASDILYRLNMPIIGITDGDLDKVVETGFVNEKSTFLEVASGFDDIVGQYIHEEIFLSRDTLEIPFDEEASSVEEFKSVMFKVFKSRVLEKTAEIVPSFVEKDHNYEVINSYHKVVDDDEDLVEDLDEFIDGFESEVNDEEEIYLDEDFESPVDEVYLDEDYGSPVDEVYLDEDYPSEDEYLENLSDEEIYYDEVLVSESEADSSVDEVFVDHDLGESQLEEIFVDHDLGESQLEEIFVEHSVESGVDSSVDEVFVDHDLGVSQVEEIFVEHDLEESQLEDANVDSEVEELEDANVDSEVEELEDADGWEDYIEEEFGDSLKESDESEE